MITSVSVFLGQVTFVSPIRTGIARENRQVTAMITPVEPPGRSRLTLDFNLSNVDPEDRHLVGYGAEFYYMISEVEDERGIHGEFTITMIRPREGKSDPIAL